MKKILITLLLTLSLLLTYLPAQAAQSNYRFDDAEEIRTDEAMVIDSINSFADWNGNSLLTKNTLHYENFVCFYPCMDIGDDPCPSKERIEEIRESGHHVYLHMIYENGLTYVATVAKGLPLREELKDSADEELIRYIKEHEGKWSCDSMSACYGKVNYKQYVESVLKKRGISSADIVFVTWFPQEGNDPYDENGNYLYGTYHWYEKAALCYTDENEEPIVIDLWEADEEAASRPTWFKRNGEWHYHLDLNTNAENGWYKISGKWYYFDEYGMMQTGWVKDKGKWYYLNASGAMQTGWLKDKGKWYYLNASGAMLTGWAKVKGKWYYLNKSGAMLTGWQKIGGKWYYLEASGAMRTANLTYKGKLYRFGSDGACIHP